MHPGLNIEEILLLICSFLDSRDSYHFALTCRRFREPGVRSVWRSLPLGPRFLRPLECVVPAGIACFVKYHDKPPETMRMLCASDWLTDPISTHLSYVNTVDITSVFLSNSLIQSAEQAFQNSPIFPNLRVLSYRVIGLLSIPPFFCALLSPRLSKLSLYLGFMPVTEDFLAVLSDIGPLCPSITDFSYSVGSHSSFPLAAALRKTISHLISSWKNLSILSVPELNADGYSWLSGLRQLTLSSFQSSSCDCTALLALKELRSLRGLTLHSTGHPGDAPNFMSSLGTSSLCDVEVKISSSSDSIRSEDLESLLEQVAGCSRAAESAIRLSVDIGGQLHSSCGLSSESLRPLLTTLNLGRLDLATLPFSPFEDAFIEDLARSSPKLVFLDIGTRVRCSFSPKMTFLSLYQILSHCPKIEELGLQMEVSTSIKQSHLICNHVKQRKRRCHGFVLAVGYKRVESQDTIELATILASMFDGSIQNIVYAGNTEDETGSACWRIVLEQMTRIIETRADMGS